MNGKTVEDVKTISVDELINLVKEVLSEFIVQDYEDSVPYYVGDCEVVDDRLDFLADKLKENGIN